eukprot:GHVU01227092.1.p1 GENE.GHVU01227092.1~~GHVU01227092.1.p1  ORF type:complete len:243 (-),score=13.30 GHVU01227092.1:328-1056(-)
MPPKRQPQRRRWQPPKRRRNFRRRQNNDRQIASTYKLTQILTIDSNTSGVLVGAALSPTMLDIYNSSGLIKANCQKYALYKISKVKIGTRAISSASPAFPTGGSVLIGWQTGDIPATQVYNYDAILTLRSAQRSGPSGYAPLFMGNERLNMTYTTQRQEDRFWRSTVSTGDEMLYKYFTYFLRGQGFSTTENSYEFEVCFTFTIHFKNAQALPSSALMLQNFALDEEEEEDDMPSLQLLNLH